MGPENTRLAQVREVRPGPQFVSPVLSQCVMLEHMHEVLAVCSFPLGGQGTLHVMIFLCKLSRQSKKESGG